MAIISGDWEQGANMQFYCENLYSILFMISICHFEILKYNEYIFLSNSIYLAIYLFYFTMLC